MSIPSAQPVSQFVRAGAGAGKTWNLTREVVRQALAYKQKNDQWPKMVLTTFTRKATQELKERLLIYCIEEQPEAVDFVQSNSYLNITTMHGLLSVFLSRHGYVIGLPSQFRIIDTKMGDFWRKKILKSMITEGLQTPSLQVFDISRLLKNLKSYEEVYWLKEGRALTSEDFLKLTDQVLKNFATTLEHVTKRGQSSVDTEKWETYWQELDHVRLSLMGQGPWDEKKDQLSALVSSLKKPRKSKNNPGLPLALDEDLKKVIADIKQFVSDAQYSSEYWSIHSAALAEFQAFAEIFMERLFEQKRSETALEPNDLENFSLKLLHEHPVTVQRFSADCDHWFIDEFQDTSPLQMKILEPMIGESPSYLVGDPQQSIYLFRGSRSEVFFDKQKKMAELGFEPTFLGKNYRSQERLLHFINGFFPQLSSDFAEMEAVKPSAQDMVSTTITCIAGDDLTSEVDLISRQVADLLKQGAKLKDFCILTKTHGDSERVQKRLMQLGFPVVSHSSSQFYQRREVLDAFALLHLLLNPWDDKNLILFMRSPWMAMSDQLIVEIIAEHKVKFWPQFKEYFVNHPDCAQGQHLLQAFKSKRIYGVGWAFRRTLIALGFIDTSSQVDSTGRREANLWKIINLVEKTSREQGGSLLQLAKEGARSSSLDDFAEAVDASSPVEPNKINLMTIHASKGLQFKYVFMPFLHKKPRDTTFVDFCIDQNRKLWSLRIPLVAQNEFVGGVLEKLYVAEMKRREAEESLRVLYVGTTRAEEKLFLSWTGDPQKKSWAGPIQDFANKEAGNDVIAFTSLQEVEPQTYVSSQVNQEVQDPFSKAENRFAPTVFESQSSTEDVYENFDQITDQQSKRWQGVVLHRLFEGLKHHSVEQVQELSQHWLPGEETLISNALSYVQSTKDLPLPAIIEHGFVEWGYQMQTMDKLVERRIDLWGIVDDQLWIVDYKTGSTHFKDKAFEQLKGYSVALRKYLKWNKPVKLAAVFPFSKESFVIEEKI